MKPVSTLLLALLAAGCLSEPQPVAPVGDAATVAAAPTPTLGVADTTPSEMVEVPLAFSGRYPTAAYACHAAVSCQGVETGPYENDVEVGGLQGTVTGVDVTMTWTASGPTMEKMGLAAMVMYADCEECESVEFAATTGASPLVLKADGLRVPIDPRGVLHVYFFPLNTVDGPIPVEADTETKVEVEGHAVLLRTA